MYQRPAKEEEDDAGVLRRERVNGSSSSNTRPYNTAISPTQSEFHPPYSPTNGAPPRPQFNNPYHPPTPAPLPMTVSPHIPARPTSPMTLAAPPSYHSDYQPPPRDKPVSNYYDPTSDSSERRPSENTAWSEGQTQTPQVRRLPAGLIDDGPKFNC
jgi:DNA helicase INO80